MKKKIRVGIVCVLVGLFLSSCSIFGERKTCPAYSKVNKEENTQKA